MHTLPLETISKPHQGLTGQRILIVDDDETTADILTIRLSQQGFQTSVAENGEQALLLARTDAPASSCSICDCPTSMASSSAANW